MKPQLKCNELFLIKQILHPLNDVDCTLDIINSWGWGGSGEFAPTLKVGHAIR